MAARTRGGGGQGGRGGFGNMTPEEREKRRAEMMANMTPEQRAQFEERRCVSARRKAAAAAGQGGRGGPGGGPAGPGGGRGQATGATREARASATRRPRSAQGAQSAGGSPRGQVQGGDRATNPNSAAVTDAATIDALFAPLQFFETRGRAWLYENKHLKLVDLRLGISDGTYTEVLNADTLQPGTEVVTAVITPEMASRPAGQQQNNANNPLMPQRGRRPAGPSRWRRRPRCGISGLLALFCCWPAGRLAISGVMTAVTTSCARLQRIGVQHFGEGAVGDAEAQVHGLQVLVDVEPCPAARLDELAAARTARRSSPRS